MQHGGGKNREKIISVFNTCITAQIPILKYDYDKAMTTRLSISVMAVFLPPRSVTIY